MWEQNTSVNENIVYFGDIAFIGSRIFSLCEGFMGLLELIIDNKAKYGTIKSWRTIIGYFFSQK